MKMWPLSLIENMRETLIFFGVGRRKCQSFLMSWLCFAVASFFFQFNWFLHDNLLLTYTLLTCIKKKYIERHKENRNRQIHKHIGGLRVTRDFHKKEYFHNKRLSFMYACPYKCLYQNCLLFLKDNIYALLDIMEKLIIPKKSNQWWAQATAVGSKNWLSKAMADEQPL